MLIGRHESNQRSNNHYRFLEESFMKETGSVSTVGKKLLQVLAGKHETVPPIWLMRQAGRYLPEYRAVREKAGSFLDLCLNSKLASEVTLQPVRRFGFDAAILFSDILVVPLALGRKVEFLPGEGPKLEPLSSAVGLADLRETIDQDVVAPVYETVSKVKSLLDDRTVDVDRGPPVEIQYIWPIAHQQTCLRELVQGGDCRQPILHRRIRNRLPEQIGQRADDDQDGSDPLVDHCGERAIEVLWAPNVGDFEL